ncbi:hypothetical protein QEO94_11640 [Kingella negevensis]|uniref:hypothetical protein n=1 Tax=Kingella negevensis TaxID=1522312 RepID=UPI0015D9B0DB|nr:hypothetical protein [Kingella negevensis]WII93249.1 hypothetical protein QEO94_11640 [Kingella negevensis]
MAWLIMSMVGKSSVDTFGLMKVSANQAPSMAISPHTIKEIASKLCGLVVCERIF